MKRPRRWLRACVPLLLALLLAAPLAWGRAGGGQHYSAPSHSAPSSHYSTYSGGHSDSGNAWLLFYIASHMTRGEWEALFAVLVLWWLGRWFYRAFLARPDAVPLRPPPAGPDYGAPGGMPGFGRGPAVQEQGRMRQLLDGFKTRDPGFDEAAFVQRAAAAFSQIQAAWSSQDMAPARAFISDGVMERFSIGIELQKADGLRNRMSAVNVLDARIVEVESDPHFDTLHVRLDASAVDTDVSLRDGRRVGGSNGPARFVEIWSFLRRPGAKTSAAKPGPIEGYCPSCGAPLNIADAAQCGACKSWVNSGEYDWVLSEITQESEWAVRGSGEAVPGYAELARRDPLLNTQFLEDRASVAFWRWQQALAQQSSRALRCVATEAYCRALDADAAARQYSYRDSGVGAVEVLAFEPAEPLDLAHVGVKWSGQQYQAGAGRDAPHSEVLRQHVIVLGRRGGASTDSRSGLSSCRCPNCGAPPSSREQAACEYCGTPFNDGSRQWVVTQILPIAQWRRPRTQADAAAPPAVAAMAPRLTLALGWTQNLPPTLALTVMAAAMTADSSIDPAEQRYLDQYARNNHIDPATVASLVQAGLERRLELPAPQTPQEGRACLEGLIDMSLADGSVGVDELKLILAYAEKAGITKEAVALRIKQKRETFGQDGSRQTAT